MAMVTQSIPAVIGLRHSELEKRFGRSAESVEAEVSTVSEVG